MDTHDLSPWTHQHVFDVGNAAGERGTRLVMWISAVMTVVEIGGGWWFNSMALLADGWHMSSHVVAIGLSAFAYAAARRYSRDQRFAFGTWKIEILAGFASAVLLGGVAVLMIADSLEHFFRSGPINYAEAFVVAVLGLVTNVVCTVVLARAHHRRDDSEHNLHSAGGLHHHHHHDLNLRSAYLHVFADAATSVLAVIALSGGLWLGLWWLDPSMGIVGSAVVGAWAFTLMKATSKVLLDREMDHPVVSEIREAIASPDFPGDARIADLHVWRVGKGAYACTLTLVTHDHALSARQVRQHLANYSDISHATIEIHCCDCGGTFSSHMDTDVDHPHEHPHRTA